MLKMDDHITEILSKLGWGDGTRIPAADAANRELEEKLVKANAAKVAAATKSAKAGERLAELEKHLSRTKARQTEVQKLLTAHKEQLIAEQGLYKYCEADECKLRADIRKSEKQKNDTEELNSRMQNDLVRVAKRLETLKESVSWNKDALKDWEEFLARGEETNTLIQTYSFQDAAKFKEMDNQRAKLRLEVDKLRKEAVTKSGEVQIAEQSLEKVGQMYRNGHIERQKLVAQWTESVNQLQNRDKQIENISKDIELLVKQEQQRSSEIEEAELMVKNMQSNNRELHTKIASSQVQNQRFRDQLTNLMKTLETRASDIPSAKSILSTLSTKLTQKRQEMASAVKSVEEKRQKISEWNNTIEEWKSKLQEVVDRCSNATDRARQLEDLLQNEEKQIQKQETEIERLQQLCYRQNPVLQQLKDEEKNIRSEIASLENTYGMIKKIIIKAEQERQKSKEELYALDFQIESLESRISKKSGEHDDPDENYEILEKIKELESTLADRSEILKNMETQIAQIENEMRRLGRLMEVDNKELGKLQVTMADKRLYFESGKRLLKKLKSVIPERQVEENVLRLKVAHVEKALAMEGENIYTLEKHRIEMEAAMKERAVEVEVQTDMLTAKKRALLEEKSRLRQDIAERDTRIRTLQSKHSLVTSQLGTAEDGTNLTVTQLKIRDAQEKFILQQEGDRLDATVRRAQRDIASLENTLKVLHASNKAYKRSLENVEEGGEEVVELRHYEAKYYQLQQQLSNAKRILEDKELLAQQMGEEMRELQNRQTEAKNLRQDKLDMLSNLNKEITEQKNKMTRADDSLKRNLKEARQRVTNPDMLRVYEIDILTRELKEQNQSAMTQLSQMSHSSFETHPELSEQVTKICEEKDISLPSSDEIKLRLRRKTSFTERSRDTVSVCSSVSTIYTTHDLGDSASDISISSRSQDSRRDSRKSSAASSVCRSVQGIVHTPSSPNIVTLDLEQSKYASAKSHRSLPQSAESIAGARKSRSSVISRRSVRIDSQTSIMKKSNLKKSI